MTQRRRFSRTALTARLAAFGGRCAECRVEIGPATGLEWDHIIPLELGGDDMLENLQPLCRADHTVKTATDVARIAKAKRVSARHLGIKGAKAIIPGSKASGLRKRLNGTVERRG
jgi:5-methylcytosine-specific restriction protein A